MMDDVAQTVRRIGLILERGGAPQAGGIPRAAARYAEFCAEANRRLAECAQSLRQGQSADALREAERFPRLLDLIVALDFPGLDAWRDRCRQEGWPEPEPLDAAALDELNEVYATQMPLEGTAAAFREAVHRGDDREAVRCLRVLAERDPANSAWRDQLPEFERERLEQIRASLKAIDAASAARPGADPVFLGGQAAALEALRAELRGPWSDAAAAQELLAETVERLRDRRRRLALHEAEALAESIGRAHAAGDWAALGGLLERYETLREGGFLQPGERIAAIVNQARQAWEPQERRRRQEAEFAALVGDIREELFERLEPGPRLTDLADSLRKRFPDRPLPEDLENRLPHALELLAHRAARQRLFRTLRVCAAVAAGIALFAAGAGFLAWSSAVSRWAAEIRHAMDLRDVDRAGALLRTLSVQHPLLWRSPRLRQMEGPLADLGREVLRNRLQAETLIAQVATLRDEGWTGPTQDMDRLAAAVAALQKSCGADLTAEQRDRLGAVLSELRTARARRQRTIDAAFAARLEEVGKDLRDISVDALDGAALETSLERAAELARRCDALSRELDVSPELVRAGLGRVQAALNSLRETGSQRLKAIRDLYGAGSAETFLDALGAVAALYPQDPRLKSVPAVLENRESYLAFTAYGGAGLGDPDRPGLASQVLRWAERAGPGNPFWTDVLLRYGAHLRGLSAVPDVRAGVQRLARNDLLGRLWDISFAGADGRFRSGVLRWPDDSDLSAAFVARKGAHRVNNRIIEGVLVTRGAYYVPARGDTLPEFVDIDTDNPIVVTALSARAHCQFLRRAAAALPSEHGELSRYLLERIKELHDEMAICPYLRVQLLSEFISLYSELTGPPLLPSALKRLQEGSKEIGREVNWLCSESDEHLRAREKAVFLLNRTGLDTAAMEAEQQLSLAVAEAALWSGVAWAGFVGFDGSLVLGRAQPSRLWVLRRAASPKELRPVIVDTLQEGGSRRPAVAGFVMPGEPLFMPRDGTSADDILQTVAARRNVKPESLGRELGSLLCWPIPADSLQR